MGYVLLTLWYERRRFLPAILAVTFSALLVALQGGLLLGTFASVSIPVDNTSADLWIACPGVISVDVTHPVPLHWGSRLLLPEVRQVEEYHQGFTFWRRPDSGAAELVVVVGSRLQDQALGTIRQLTPELRRRLGERGAVVVDQADLHRLGITGPGARTEVNGHAVRVVGIVRGLKGLAGPYLFCSAATARMLLRQSPDQATYLLARCSPGHVDAVARRLRQQYRGRMDVLTWQEFSLRSRLHWLVNTGGGIALLCAAALGLLVGAAITSQTLYAATSASQREYAVLRALGAPRWRMVFAVLLQSLFVGVTGVLLAVPCVFALAWLARQLNAQTQLPPTLLMLSSGVTLATATLSGFWSLRSLHLVEPASLLR